MQIDIANTKRCSKCSECTGNSANYQCTCRAATKVRKLGKQLESLNNRKPFLSSINESTFGVAMYQKLKGYDMTDKEIAKQLKWYMNKFNEWKRDNGIKQRSRPSHYEAQKSLINAETYNDLREKGLSQEDIAKHFKVAVSSLFRWRKDNGLVTPGRGLYKQ